MMLTGSPESFASWGGRARMEGTFQGGRKALKRTKNT